MTDAEIIKYVNDGAEFYLKFFADAEHMEFIDNSIYCLIKPKANEQGINFIFNIRLENLPRDEQIKYIAEIKSLKIPAWWNLQTSDELYQLIHGKPKEKLVEEPLDGDEIYMAILPDELKQISTTHDEIVIKKVDNSQNFAIWANFVNDVMNGGYPDIHPINHFHWCKRGLINCFICYKNGIPISVASIINSDSVSSLEFVATYPDFRRQGFAKAVCYHAMKDAFDNGSSIITLRAINPGTKELYNKKLGFKIYNYAI